MYIMLIGAEINAYFEEKLREVHRMASERIKAEYHEIIHGIRDSKDDDE